MLVVDNSKVLLVLDLDETLVHSRSIPLPQRVACCRILSYHVYKRPGLDQFLAETSRYFDLAIWSAGGADYVQPLVSQLLEPLAIKPVFVWAAERCTRRYDPETQEEYFIKDFNKLARRGVNLRRALIVDNLPRNCQRNYGNAIYIKSYEGDSSDQELHRLSSYLRTLKDIDNLRAVEKRDWETTTALEQKPSI